MEKFKKLIGKIYNVDIGYGHSADAVVISIEVDAKGAGVAKLIAVDFACPILTENIGSLKNEITRNDVDLSEYDLSQGVYSCTERLQKFAKKLDDSDFIGSLI